MKNMQKMKTILFVLLLSACKKEEVIPSIVESTIMYNGIEIVVQAKNSSRLESSDITIIYRNRTLNDFENIVDAKKILINFIDSNDFEGELENSIVSRIKSNTEEKQEIFLNKKVKRINSLVVK
jgi:hypothetical protein